MSQFTHVAVAEKFAHLKHEEWVNSRETPAEELAARALQLLEKARGNPVEPTDRI